MSSIRRGPTRPQAGGVGASVRRHGYLLVSLAAHALLLALFYYFGAYRVELARQNEQVGAGAELARQSAMEKRVLDMAKIKELLAQSRPGAAPPGGANAADEPEFGATTLPTAPEQLLAQARELSASIDGIERELKVAELARIEGISQDQARARLGPAPTVEAAPAQPGTTPQQLAAQIEQLEAKARAALSQRQRELEARRDGVAVNSGPNTGPNAVPNSGQEAAAPAGAGEPRPGSAQAGADGKGAEAGKVGAAGKPPDGTPADAGGAPSLAARADAAGTQQGRGPAAAAGAPQGEAQPGPSGDGGARRGAGLSDPGVERERGGGLGPSVDEQAVAQKMASFINRDVVLPRTVAARYNQSGEQIFDGGQGRVPALDPRAMRKGAGRMFGRGGEYADRVYVNSWYLIGPFEGKHGRELFNNHHYPPERGVVLDAAYVGKDKRLLKWRYVSADSYPLVPAGLEEDAVYYGYTELMVEREQDVTLWIGADDDAQVWLNDVQVWDGGNVNKAWFWRALYDTPNSYVRDFNASEGQRKVRLRKGRNKLFFKMANGPVQGFFSLVITK